MCSIRVWARLLGLTGTVIEDVTVKNAGDGVEVVLAVRPLLRERGRCGICGRRSSRFDCGGCRRRWRALDLGTSLCWIEADALRVCCARHGVVVARVPWARHEAGFTRAFEDEAAWLGVNTSNARVEQINTQIRLITRRATGFTVLAR